MKKRAIFVAAMLGVCACKPQASSDSQVRKLAAGNTGDGARPIVLSLGSGVTCLWGEKNRQAAQAVLDEAKTNASVSLLNNSRMTKDLDTATALVGQPNGVALCDAALETWALQSFALKKLAPYDVAAVNIPALPEIQLLLTGGSIAAGLMGDRIGSVCMSVINAGLSYSESKGWITCKH